MLFQRPVLEDLFDIIESYHHTDAWIALLRCIDPLEINGASFSEYEIYFNFVFSRSNQMKIRHLLWNELSNLSQIDSHRHDGYHIDLVNPIRSSEDVETIINVLNNAFTAHEQSAAGAHTAFGISVNDEFVNFSAEDVQNALIELDRLSTLIAQKHQDEFHQTGVALNRRGIQFGQGNLKETTLAGTVFKTEISKATNIFQVMRPNVARVTSKDIELKGLNEGTAKNLRIQAGGIDRDPLDVNLTAIIPSRTSPLLYDPIYVYFSWLDKVNDLIFWKSLPIKF